MYFKFLHIRLYDTNDIAYIANQCDRKVDIKRNVDVIKVCHFKK